MITSVLSCVYRLNLRFLDESESEFMLRLHAAEMRRDKAEALLRYHLYIREHFDADVVNMSAEQMQSIMHMVARSMHSVL